MLKAMLKGIDGLSEWIGKTTAWLSLIMILVLVYEVSARYLLNNPTEWAHETTTMLYGTFCMLGAVWTLREKGHVRTEVIYQIMPPKLQTFCEVLSGLIILVMLVVFFYASYEFALESWKSKEVSSKSTWGVIVYPFKTVVPITVALMILQQIAHTIRDIADLFGYHGLHDTHLSVQD